MKFRVGQRVRLLANKEEGWPAERGEVIEDNEDGSYVVEVDMKYRSGPDDDGVRDGVPDFAMRPEESSRKRKRKKKKSKRHDRRRKNGRKRRSKRRR